VTIPGGVLGASCVKLESENEIEVYRVLQVQQFLFPFFLGALTNWKWLATVILRAKNMHTNKWWADPIMAGVTPDIPEISGP